MNGNPRQRPNNGFETRPTTENNLVAPLHIAEAIKQGSKYFVQDLGLASTMVVEKKGKIDNTGDTFAVFYRNHFKTTVLLKGKVGNISIYFDPYLKGNSVRFWLNGIGEEFEWDTDLVKTKGIDSMLGKLVHDIKMVSQQIADGSATRPPSVPNGQADKLIKNPGSVTSADIMAYLDSKRKTI